MGHPTLHAQRMAANRAATAAKQDRVESLEWAGLVVDISPVLARFCAASEVRSEPKLRSAALCTKVRHSKLVRFGDEWQWAQVTDTDYSPLTAFPFTGREVADTRFSGC